MDYDASDDGLGTVLSQNHQGDERVEPLLRPNISIVPHETRCWH